MTFKSEKNNQYVIFKIPIQPNVKISFYAYIYKDITQEINEFLGTIGIIIFSIIGVCLLCFIILICICCRSVCNNRNNYVTSSAIQGT